MWIAVIGHGSSPQGRGLGIEIDRADQVIRMFNCEWQPAGDYGIRYTYGVWPAWRRHWQREIEWHPSEGWLWMDDGKPEPGWDPPGPYEKIDLSWVPDRLSELTELDGRTAISKGAGGALMAMHKWPGAKIRTYGLDAVSAGIMQGCQYHKDHPHGHEDPAIAATPSPRNRHGGLVTGPHHWAAERAVLLETAVKAGCELEFVQ